MNKKENFSKKSKFIKVSTELGHKGYTQVGLPQFKGAEFNSKLEELLTIENDFYPCFDWEFPPPVLHLENIHPEKASELFDKQSVIKEKFSIYIHIPFCISLCKFCYYSVITKAKTEKVSEYVQYLKKEIDLYKAQFKGLKCESIYFGGGTPTYLSEEELEELVIYLKNSFDIETNAEITMEASPGTLTPSKIQKMKDLGINRVSYGIQTLDRDILAEMNRDYDLDESIRDVKNLLEIIGNINIDTMYGFDGEDKDTLHDTVSTFIEMGVPIITIYAMDNQRSTYTPSANGPSEDKFRKEKMVHFNEIRAFLYEKGYVDVLQNTFIKKDSSCSYKHQVRRWDNLTLLAMGVSSQGYAPEKIYQNIQDVKGYYAKLDEGKIPVVYATILSPDMEFARELTSKLRFTSVDIKEMDIKYNIELEIIFKNLITELIQLKFVELNDGIMKITEAGAYYNNIIPLLFTPDSFKEQILGFPPEMINSYPVSYVLTNLGKTECIPLNTSKYNCPQ